MISVKQILQSKYEEIDSRVSGAFSKAGVKYKPFAEYLDDETASAVAENTAASDTGGLDLDSIIRLLGGASVQTYPTQASGNITASENSNINAAKKYDDIIAAASEKYGLSVELIKGIIQAESDFNPNCVSSAGAVGLMQLMPETAAEVGVTDRYDPAQNIDGATHYIKKLLDRFNGDIKLALAAYNTGPAKVAKLNITSSADTEKYNQIPESIRKYVDRVLSYMLGFQQAA